MQQFAAIKKDYPDCLILFRLGDFYELFAEDAKVGAELLDITLTRKAQSKGGDVPMAGVPFHALDAYLPKLIEAGYKVAIVEQVVPADGRTLVEREVVRVVTPGTFVSRSMGDTKHLNEIRSCAVIVQDGTQQAIAFADLSTGDIMFSVCDSTDQNWIKQELERFLPNEVLIDRSSSLHPSLETLARDLQFLITTFAGWSEWQQTATQKIQDHLGIKTLEAFGLHTQPLAQQAVAILLGYASYTQKQAVPHLRQIRGYQAEAGLQLDPATQRNLELFVSLRHHDKRGTLLNWLDQTTTALGSRTLLRWVQQPSGDETTIHSRLEAVQELLQHSHVLSVLKTHLKSVGDIERLVARISLRLGTPRDLLRLGESLLAATQMQSSLEVTNSIALRPLEKSHRVRLEKLAQYIQTTLDTMAPNDVARGQVIQAGVDKDLDTWRTQLNTQQDWMVQYEQTLRQETGISTLRVRNNKVFGYYIEVSRGAASKVPENFERKQTLVTGERYSTPQLKEQEALLFTAAEKILQREEEIFSEVVNTVQTHTEDLQKLAKHLGQVDVLCCFAALAHNQRLVKPVIHAGNELEVVNGRHPVVESLLPVSDFIANDTVIDPHKKGIFILTGPNMGGKSVFLRQTALIVLLAHIGSFVPADSARIPLTDRVFVRSGAADNIADGQSTFLVEMVETASILRQATARSLVLLDEVGRGTSTYDGLSLAWAIVEFFATKKDGVPKTIFATHYLELQQLAELFPQVGNLQVSVHQEGQSVVFMHQILPGGAAHSFGIHVAGMAGMPESVQQRARELLTQFEAQDQVDQQSRREQKVLTDLKQVALDKLSPAQVMMLVESWQEKLNAEKNK